MRLANKVLIMCYWVFILLSTVAFMVGCEQNKHAVNLPKEDVSTTVSANIYLKDFDSTSPVRLDEDALKTANDWKLSVFDESKIARVKHELKITSCISDAGAAEVGDLRLLIEFKDSAGQVQVWRGSQFYFQDGRGGNICEFSASDKQRLERALRSLGP